MDTLAPGKMGPVAGAERIATLDVLRGFAVLGILAMNIQSYSMIGAAYFSPTAFGDLSGANYWIWRLSDLLANMKFVTIFSMLFGAGIVLMSERAAAAGSSPAGLHYRRMAWLLLFGLVHAYLLWSGDILVTYALSGLIVFLFRRLRPGQLLLFGLLSLVVGTGLMLMGGFSSQYWGEEALAEFRVDQLPTAAMVAEELEKWRAGWSGPARLRLNESLEMHVFVFPFYLGWRAVGCMLIGMALFKWGVLSGKRSAQTYRRFVGLGLLVGLPLVNWGTRLKIDADWEPVYSFFIFSQFNYWASLLVALGWIGGIVLMTRSVSWTGVTSRLAACGRMAFSNYIAQTLICTTLFYGYGFGLVGRVSRLGQAGIVLAIWILQLWISPLWLRRYRFGPLEWLWRSLSYGARQPMRRV
jgi:uncharacterized protein